MPTPKVGRLVLMWLACAAIASAHAQHVYRCHSADAVSYQSQPCPPGTASRRWDYVPGLPTSPALQARLDAIGRELIQRNRPIVPTTRRRARGERRPPRADACARARHRQQATLERLKLKRTHDQLRRLDDEVTRHCR